MHPYTPFVHRPLDGHSGWSKSSASVRGTGFARISLIEEALSLILWQPDRCWSRREAAKTCMAACASILLHWSIRAVVRDWRKMPWGQRVLVWAKCSIFTAPTFSHFNSQNNKPALQVLEKFGVDSFLVPPRVPYNYASVLLSLHAWLTCSREQRERERERGKEIKRPLWLLSASKCRFQLSTCRWHHVQFHVGEVPAHHTFALMRHTCR